MLETMEYAWWLHPFALTGFGLGFLLVGIGLVMVAWKR